PAWLRVREAARHVGLKILDRDARWKRHAVFVVPADVELVRGWDVVHKLPSLIEHSSVVGDDVGELRDGPEQVITLAPTRVIGCDELRTRKNRNSKACLGRRRAVD